MLQTRTDKINEHNSNQNLCALEPSYLSPYVVDKLDLVIVREVVSEFHVREVKVVQLGHVCAQLVRAARGVGAVETDGLAL